VLKAQKQLTLSIEGQRLTSLSGLCNSWRGE